MYAHKLSHLKLEMNEIEAQIVEQFFLFEIFFSR